MTFLNHLEMHPFNDYFISLKYTDESRWQDSILCNLWLNSFVSYVYLESKKSKLSWYNQQHLH